MTRLVKLQTACLLAAALIALPFGRTVSNGQAPARPRQAWTLEEALDALSLRPRDAYLQYVALQLARRAGRFDEVEARVRRPQREPHPGLRPRRRLQGR